MGDIIALAIGNPSWPSSRPNWDLRPLVVIVAALPILRYWLYLRLRPIVWLATAAAAPVFTGLGDAIGFSVLVPLTLLAAATGSLVMRTRSHRDASGGVCRDAPGGV